MATWLHRSPSQRHSRTNTEPGLLAKHDAPRADLKSLGTGTACSWGRAWGWDLVLPGACLPPKTAPKCSQMAPRFPSTASDGAQHPKTNPDEPLLEGNGVITVSTELAQGDRARGAAGRDTGSSFPSQGPLAIRHRKH